MRRTTEPPALTAVSEVLRGLSDTLGGAEDDLLSSLVVMGEADAQQTVDGWVDQLVDLLRAVDEVSVQHRTTLARATSRHTTPDSESRRLAVENTVPSESR